MPRLRSPKSKGDEYERSIAAFLNANLFDGAETVRRALLSGGGRSFEGGGEPDLEGLPLIWAECKRTEALNIRRALEQAELGISRKSNPPGMATVFTRRNREPLHKSIVAMRLDDWLTLYRSHLILTGRLTPTSGTTPATPACDHQS